MYVCLTQSECGLDGERMEEASEESDYHDRGEVLDPRD